MRTWQRHAENLERYYVQLYYYLEGQRTVHHVELCDALSSSAAKEVRLDHWVRIVDYRYSLRPLSAAGSVIQGGRFNIGRDLDPLKFPTFPALYLAEDYETAYRERFGVSGNSQALQGHQLALRRPESFTSVVVQGTVLNVFDLRSDSSLRAFANIIVKFKLPDRIAYSTDAGH